MSETLAYMLKTNANQMLGSMSVWLQKAAEHARSGEVEDSVYMSARLYPDMLPMEQQVRIASDISMLSGSLLGGVEMQMFPPEEQSLIELAGRAERALAFLSEIDDEALSDAPGEETSLKMRSGVRSMSRRDFALRFFIPNICFHTTTAYGLLRMQGVPLGKVDFLWAADG